jgi:hypothetical protein
MSGTERSEEELMHTTQPTRREIGIALAFTFAVLFGVLLLKAASFEEAQRYDFSVRYAAGLIVRQGNGAKLYDVQEQARIQEGLFPGRGFLFELHPPFEVLLYAPLTKFSYLHAYVVWGIFNIFLWTAFVYLARRCAPVPKQTFQYFLVCFTFFPLWINLHHGQTSLLLLISYCLTFLALKGKQDFRAGAFLGLGLVKFQLVLPFAVICVLRKKWRVMGGFAAAALTLTALSIVTVGPEGVLSYVQLLFSTIKHPNNPVHVAIVPSNMPNVRGFLVGLMKGSIGLRWIYVLTALVSGFFLLFTARLWRRLEERHADDALGPIFAAGITVSLMTGFYLFLNDLSPMLLAAFLVLGSPQWRVKSRWRLLFNSALVIMFVPLVYLLLIHWGRIYLLWIVLAAFVVGVFGMLNRSLRVGANRLQRAL